MERKGLQRQWQWGFTKKWGLHGKNSRAGFAGKDNQVYRPGYKLICTCEEEMRGQRVQGNSVTLEVVYQVGMRSGLLFFSGSGGWGGSGCGVSGSGVGRRVTLATRW